MKKNFLLFRCKSIYILNLIVLILLSNYSMNAQCNETIEFSYSHYSGSLPISLSFTNLSTGVPTSQTWTANNSLLSGGIVGNNTVTTEDAAFTFNSYGLFVICLEQEYSDCPEAIGKCYTIAIANDCIKPDLCQSVFNGNFEDLSNPSDYGTQGSSSNFNQDVCGWASTRLTSYYCHYPDDTYVSLRAGRFMTEQISSTVPAQMEAGKQYRLTFDYSLQLIDNQFNQEVTPDKIEFNLFSYSNPNQQQTIGTLISPEINSPSSDGIYLANNNYDCYPPSQEIEWVHYEGEVFTYSNGDLVFLRTDIDANISLAGDPALFLDNIEIIEECNLCAAVPNYSWLESDCNTYTLAGNNQNPDAPGLVSWSIDGITMPAFSGSYDIENLTFPFFGDYEVCMNITCPNGATSQDCQIITVNSIFNGVACEVCQGPELVVAEAQRCGKESNEYVINSFAITVPKGHSPCNGQVFSQSFNGDILLNDYVIDNTGATEDVIYLSFTFLADDADTENFGALFAVCSPDGLSTECFRIQISDPQTCNECSDDQSIISNMSVSCVDNDSNDNLFIYAGSFTIDVPQGVFFCGSNSPNAGVALDVVNANTNGSYNIDYTISTNNDGNFNKSLTLCFHDQEADVKYCYNVDLSISNPCMPDDDNCEIDIPPYTIACTDVKDGMATFIFSYSLHLPEFVKNGYEFCDIDPITGRDLITDRATITIGNNEFEIEPTIGVNAYIFAVELEVSCEDLASNPSSELIVNLCTETDMVCADLDFNLLCPECETIGGKRSSQKTVDDYSISPNPASQLFSILAPESEETQKYQIYNTSGQIVMSGTLIVGENIINFGNDNNGLFLVKLTNGQESVTKRLLMIK